ncbi:MULTISPECIES: hypothetical protein [unclassified Mesorhizobium]|nr:MULTISPECIES: hypothetical protein [unclassified Mesorhizobium]
MDAKQIGSNLILPAFELVEYFQIFAQRLPQPKTLAAAASMPAAAAA